MMATGETGFPRTRLDYFQRYRLENKVEDYKEQLVDKARWLIDDLERLIQHLEEGSTINSLGEVQGKGSEIDRLCGLYMQTRDLAEEMRQARDADKEDGAK